MVTSPRWLKGLWLGLSVGWLALLPFTAAQSAVPNVLAYQGRVAAGGAPFAGVGQFKFVLYQDDGPGGASAVPWWNSAGSATGLNEPTTAVSLAVANGLFAVELGNPAIPGMALLPSTGTLASGLRLYLRVWFSDGVHGYQPLTPDQPLASVPYALQAGSIASSATLGIGTDAPYGAVDVARAGTGAGRDIVNQSIADGAGANYGGLGGMRRLAFRSDLMALSAYGDDAVYLFDVSNATNPVFRAVMTNNVGGFANLDAPYGLAFNGNVLAMSAVNGDSVTLVNVANPSAPVPLSQVRLNVGGYAFLNSPYDVAFSGNLLAVCSYSSAAVTLIDTTVPTSPVRRGVITNGLGSFTGLTGAYLTVFINPTNIAIGSYDSSTVVFADVSNPNAPVRLSTIKDGVNGVNLMAQVGGMAASGNLLAVSSYGDNAVSLFDVSDPGAPVLKGVMSSATYPLMNAMRGVAFRNGRLAAASVFGNAVFEFDITNPADPRLLFEGFDSSSSMMLGPYGVAYHPNGPLYVAAEGSSRLTIFGNPTGTANVGMVVNDRVGIGTTSPTESLEVAGNAFVAGRARVASDLYVHGSAYKPAGGSWLSLSDVRLKNVERPFTRGLDAIRLIDPVVYRYKTGTTLNLPTNQPFAGVLAQEVERAIPEAVEDGPDGFKTVNSDPVVWTMLNALKELERKNEALQRRVEELERAAAVSKASPPASPGGVPPTP